MSVVAATANVLPYEEDGAAFYAALLATLEAYAVRFVVTKRHRPCAV